MTFALVVPGPLDRRSGGYSYDVDLVEALRTLGHGVEVWSLPEGRKARAVVSTLLRSSTVDVVVFDALVHGNLGKELDRHRRNKRARWVGLVHHLAWLEAPTHAGIQALQKRERCFLEAMDAFWFNSEDTRHTVAALRGPEAAAKPSVVCQPPLPVPQGAFLRPSDQGRLLFLANLVPRKNLLALIEALGLLVAQGQRGWSLTVAGSPGFDPGYARRCQQRAAALGLEGLVRWEGRVSDERREELWRQTDLFTLPSLHEGWGMAHAEALVRGLPVLAVPTGGVLEVLGDAALWSQPDSASLANALEAFLTDGSRRHELAQRARHRAPALRACTGFAPLAAFLEDWNPELSPTPLAFSFRDYLEAKATVDDRSLHPRVAEAVWSGLNPARVWDLGGGTGTMARRLREAGRLGPQTDYLLVDQDRALLQQAEQRLGALFAPGAFQTQQANLLAFWESPPSPPPTLVIAHALLDLFDPAATAPALARLGAERYWLTHLFDGLTAWDPVVDPDLDQSLIEAYHRSMSERAPGGAQGSPRSGRDWLGALPAAGFRILDAASSDWILHPAEAGYTALEKRFLESMVHFFRSSLTGRDDVDQGGLAWWLAVRQGQIQRGEARLVVHQIDIAADLKPGRPGATFP